MVTNAETTAERVGPYRVVRRLATGGTSDVLLAKAEGPLGFERTVVLKLLLAQLRGDENVARMFAREASAYARLSHTSIVRLFDFFSVPSGSRQGQLCMVLEFIDGPPLTRFRTMLKAVGKELEDKAAIHIAANVFDALAAAHSAADEAGENAPVIHRDVNPSNVLLNWEGHVKLADFGVAKVTGMSGQSIAGLIKGTYGYMAPEQVTGSEPVTPRADVYAAAIILWELLTRRRAFQRGALPEIEALRAMAEPRLTPLDTIRPDIEKSVRDAVKRALEPRAEKRKITAEEMVSVLHAIVPAELGRERLAAALALVRHDPRAAAATSSIPAPSMIGDPKTVQAAVAPPATVQGIGLPAPVAPGPLPRPVARPSTALPRSTAAYPAFDKLDKPPSRISTNTLASVAEPARAAAPAQKPPVPVKKANEGKATTPSLPRGDGADVKAEVVPARAGEVVDATAPTAPPTASVSIFDSLVEPPRLTLRLGSNGIPLASRETHEARETRDSVVAAGEEIRAAIDDALRTHSSAPPPVSDGSIEEVPHPSTENGTLIMVDPKRKIGQLPGAPGSLTATAPLAAPLALGATLQIGEDRPDLGAAIAELVTRTETPTVTPPALDIARMAAEGMALPSDPPRGVPLENPLPQAFDAPPNAPSNPPASDGRTAPTIPPRRSSLETGSHTPIPARPGSSVGAVVAVLVIALVAALAITIGYVRSPARVATASNRPTPSSSATAPSNTADAEAVVEDAALAATAAATPSGAPAERPHATAPSKDASVAVTPAPEPPPAASSAGEASSAAIAEGMGVVVTKGAAAGRRIFVDDKTLGQTPESVTVKCGAHSVRIGSSGKSQIVDVPCRGEVVVSDK